MQHLSALNWWAILVASVAAVVWVVVLGVIIGDAEHATLGVNPRDILPPPAGPAFTLLALAYLSTAIVIALLIRGLGLETWWQGVATGLLVAIALFATVSFSGGGLFGDPFLPRRFNAQLLLIRAASGLTYPMVMGLILVLWQKRPA